MSQYIVCGDGDIILPRFVSHSIPRVEQQHAARPQHTVSFAEGFQLIRHEHETKLTHDTTLAFAKALVAVNSGMVLLIYQPQGQIVRNNDVACVKGRTEDDLAKLEFKAEYNFRLGLMQPFPGQKNWKLIFKFLVKAIIVITPKSVLSLHEVGLAMIKAVTVGYEKNILEAADVKQLAKR